MIQGFTQIGAILANPWSFNIFYFCHTFHIKLDLRNLDGARLYDMDKTCLQSKYPSVVEFQIQILFKVDYIFESYRFVHVVPAYMFWKCTMQSFWLVWACLQSVKPLCEMVSQELLKEHYFLGPKKQNIFILQSWRVGWTHMIIAKHIASFLGILLDETFCLHSVWIKWLYTMNSSNSEVVEGKEWQESMESHIFSFQAGFGNQIIRSATKYELQKDIESNWRFVMFCLDLDKMVWVQGSPRLPRSLNCESKWFFRFAIKVKRWVELWALLVKWKR